MGDALSAISKDERRYVALCRKYNEPVHTHYDGSPDCYSSHARKLEKLSLEEHLNNEIDEFILQCENK